MNKYKQRFDERYIVDPVSGCWNWIAGTFKNGYSRFHGVDKSGIGYRSGYILYKGPIPNKMHLHHICENIRCVNPNHLEVVTQREHMRNLSPNASAFKNKNKTHCPLGHPYVSGLGIHNNPRRCEFYLQPWHRQKIRDGVLIPE